MNLIMATTGSIVLGTSTTLTLSLRSHHEVFPSPLLLSSCPISFANNMTPRIYQLTGFEPCQSCSLSLKTAPMHKPLNKQLK